MFCSCGEEIKKSISFQYSCVFHIYYSLASITGLNPVITLYKSKIIYLIFSGQGMDISSSLFLLSKLMLLYKLFEENIAQHQYWKMTKQYKSCARENRKLSPSTLFKKPLHNKTYPNSLGNIKHDEFLQKIITV